MKTKRTSFLPAILLLAILSITNTVAMAQSHNSDKPEYKHPTAISKGVKFAQYGVFGIRCSAGNADGTTTLEYAKKVEVMRPIPPQYSISSESNSGSVTEVNFFF